MPDESSSGTDATRVHARVHAGALMDDNETQPQSFVEMVLALLEGRFPWLGKGEPPSRAETVDQLSDCCRSSRKLNALR
jgi:hypothetical protein